MARRWEERDREDYRDERYRDRDRTDRGVVSRAGDEVRSWFGDDEAERRRRMDRHEQQERNWQDRMAGSMERAWDQPRSTARVGSDRDRDQWRGFGESQDNDRRWDRSREPRSYYWGSESDREARPRGADYWSSERSFGDTSRYAGAEPYDSTRWNRPSQGAWRDRGEVSYSGRGPRGYQRGDERIREDVCDRLTEDARIDASDIEVQVQNAEITLSGSVRTREEKHLAENVVEHISGVREVNNNLKVRPSDEVLGTARSGASTLGLSETPPPAPSKNK